MDALRYLAEGRAVLVPPVDVRRAAREGLAKVASTTDRAAVSLAEALARGEPITAQKALALQAWHAHTAQPAMEEHLLRGGDPGRAWVAEVLRHFEDTGELAEASTPLVQGLRRMLAETRGDPVRAVRALTEGTPDALVTDLRGLDDALQSSRQELAAYHKKLAPHAAQTAPRGLDVMQLRVVLREVVSLVDELRTNLQSDFGLK